MMTDGQASAWLISNGATFVKTDAQAQWWKLRDGSWVSKVRLANGLFDLRRHAASSCNCG